MYLSATEMKSSVSSRIMLAGNAKSTERVDAGAFILGILSLSMLA